MTSEDNKETILAAIEANAVVTGTGSIDPAWGQGDLSLRPIAQDQPSPHDYKQQKI